MKAGRVLVVGLLAAGVGAAAITALCCTDQTGSSPLMAVAAAPAQPVIFSATTLEVGQTLDLEARAQDGTPLTGVSWLSTDVSIADVVGSTVTGRVTGSTVISGAHATAGAAALRVTVVFTPPPPDTTPPDTTAPPPPTPTGCVDGIGRTWNNTAFPAQTGNFVIEFDATPSGIMDGVLGVSNGPASAYSGLASIVRFYTAGRIEVRNGGAYVASSVTYSAGVTYRFRLTIDIPSHRYSVTVTPAGGTETTIGTNLAFRTEQASVTRLNNLAAIAASGGTLSACLVRVEGGAAPPPPPPPPPPPDSQPAPAPLPSGGVGIWLSPQEIAALPMSGAGWSNVKSAADKACGTPNLANQDDNANVCVLAKALVYARTGGASYRDGVLSALRSIANSGTYSGRALALGRELAAYVISADIIGLAQIDAALDAQFKTKITQLRTTATSGGPTNLIRCHEGRPNNWGTWCGFSRLVVAIYLRDAVDMDRAASVYRGWTGERNIYAGFTFGELGWQCDPTKPVGVNPRGCMKDGHDIDGVLPDDQRRCSTTFEWPPCTTDYIWGALEGALPTALVLHRAGYSWAQASGDSAIVRAYRWVYGPNNFPPTGNDTWQPYLVNHIYGTSYPEPPATPGKNIGWTDWTHNR